MRDEKQCEAVEELQTALQTDADRTHNGETGQR